MDYILLSDSNCNGGGSSVSLSSSSWSPPPVGFVKVNCDTGFVGCDLVGFGIVFRDDKGAVLASASRVVKGKWDPSVAEAKATSFGLQLASDLGFCNLNVESDNKCVVEKLHQRSTSRSSLGLILEDCLMLGQHFQHLSWLYVPRSCNAVAHALAKAYSCVVDFVWVEDVPPSVRNFVHKDMENHVE